MAPSVRRRVDPPPESRRTHAAPVFPRPKCTHEPQRRDDGSWFCPHCDWTSPPIKFAVHR